MQLKSLMRSLCGAAAMLLFAGTAQAALQGRDLDGNGVTDAFYDTDLNITWLRNANSNGAMDWNTATAWAAAFSFAGLSDWRLPRGSACHWDACTSTNELSHLWYLGLGNLGGGPMSNVGGFLNVQTSSRYWTDYPGFTVAFSDGDVGVLGTSTSVNNVFSMIVRDGDVTPVPEPATYALMLLGLAGLIAANRRR